MTSVPDCRHDACSEAVALCSRLIAIDTSNPGPGERPAAEYVAALLDEVGIHAEITESEKGRASLVARVEGSQSQQPGLLLHHHLDVVPAVRADWQVDPFAGEVRDGYVWGRGAVDMKNSVAATLSVIRLLARSGRRPKRDLVLAFTADEEAGGKFGVKHLVRALPEYFVGCTEALGECGGFSMAMPADRRLYPVQVAEKGQAWFQLTTRGVAGHAMLPTNRNPIPALAEAITAIAQHRFAASLCASNRAFLEVAADLLGQQFDPESPETITSALGPMGRLLDASLTDTCNITVLNAGYKTNVVPAEASAVCDGRFLPGREEAFEKEIHEALPPDVALQWLHRDIAVETSFEGALAQSLTDALLHEDPQAVLAPYCMPGGTDAKTYSTLGMRCFGFTPLRLPPDLDFISLFHGVDERIPIESLAFSVHVLHRLLTDRPIDG